MRHRGSEKTLFVLPDISLLANAPPPINSMWIKRTHGMGRETAVNSTALYKGKRDATKRNFGAHASPGRGSFDVPLLSGQRKASALFQYRDLSSVSGLKSRPSFFGTYRYRY